MKEKNFNNKFCLLLVYFFQAILSIFLLFSVYIIENRKDQTSLK